jgi:hypothetical protein
MAGLEGALASFMADAFPLLFLIRALTSIFVGASACWEGALASTLADAFLLCF